MSLANHPISQEIVKIISPNGRRLVEPVKLYHTAFIHVMKTNKTYRTYKVLNMDINRDYDKNLTDEISISILFPPGIWTDEVYPYLDDIEITVMRGSSWSTTNQESRRYKAYAKNPTDIRKQSPHLQNVSTDSIDRMDVITLQFQLVPLLIEKLITVQAGTNFVNCKVGDALRTMMMNEASKLDGLQDQDMLQGIDMVESDNQQEYQNIPIPHATKLINLPNYMQKHLYGIYQQGIGHYIQNAMWYVYPLWRVDRRDPQVRFVNIFVTHRDFLRYAEYTYRTEGNDVYLIGTLEGESEELNSAKLLNNGNGIRAVNPNVQSTQESIKVEGNKAIISRANNISEFNIVESPNGVQHAPLANKDSNDINIYEQVSRLEGKIGKVYAIVWQNSHPELIKPGSIVRLHYVAKNNKQEVIEGVVMKTHHFIQAVSPGLNSTAYDCTTGIFIYSKEIQKT